MPLIFSRIWCMPSPKTFTMPPVKKLLERYVGDGILFDPPYSLRQVKECYDNIGYAICCSWNTNGFGRNRGFKPIEILLIPHGGHHNDTIVTVEMKINHTLTSWNESENEQEESI